MGYAVSTLAVAGLTLGLKALFPIFPLGKYPMPYIVLIMLVAYVLGEGPAILTFILSVLAFHYFFTMPARTIWPLAHTSDSWAQFAAFFLGMLIVGFATSLMRRSRQRIQRLVGELQRSEERYRQLYEETPHAYLIVGIDGRIRRANKAASVMLGYSIDDLVGRTVFDLYADTPAGKEKARKVFERFSAGQETHGEELEMLRADGRPVWISLTVIPIHDADGRVVESRSMATDVTDRKRAEQELMRLRDEADKAAALARDARDAAQRDSELLRRALLPAKPSIGAGYRVASRYLPGSAGLEIGGDFYDVFETEAGKIAIVLGDVSGKGVEAAALAAATRGTVRAFAYDISSAGEALTHANAVLTQHEQASVYVAFVTIFLAIIDPPTGKICYSSAGHPPSAVFRAATGDVEFLTFGGPPVAVVAKHKFGEWESHLDAGDKILFYTDGISEARRGLELFGTEGVKSILKRHGRLPPEDLASEMVAAASGWAGGRFTDDVAVIVVERQG
jgi:sigma-B regulation protein RsbU (phosphoserine phosphatase)